MDVDDFEAARPRLLGVAYRMLGSLADAEDVVQEAWIRWQHADRSDVANPSAWLTTVTSRLALDRLRAQRRRKEEYVGPWLPEPVAGAPGPEERAELAESLTLGFLVVLDRLSPVERAVFLLADVFGEPFSRIAQAVGKSEAACRQIASRARRRVRDERVGEGPADRSLLEDLVLAMSSGEAGSVVRLLAPEVVLVSDGGPRVHAARHPVVGPERVSRFLVNVAARWPARGGTFGLETVNGAPAVVVRFPRRAIVLTADRVGDRLAAVRLVVNPDKLVSLDRAVSLE